MTMRLTTNNFAHTFIVTAILLLGTSSLFADPSIELIQKGIALSIEQKYDQALSIFEAMKHTYPDHPAGAFFTAAVLQSRMMDFETGKWQELFYREIDQAVRLAKQQLADNPQDSQMLFFYGAALGYKSFQLGRNKKYLSAIKTALFSIKRLNKAIELDSSFCDPYLGVGSYKYWRSNLTQKISWLPFFHNRKQQGIAMLERALRCSLFSKWAALSNLAWISIEEKDYDAAIKYSRMGLEHFPHSRFFMWPLAEAQFKNGQYQQALASYTDLLQSVTSASFNNHYNEIHLYWKIAQCYDRLGKPELAIQACQKLLAILPDKEVEKRAKDKKEKAKKLMSKILSDQKARPKLSSF